MALINATYFFGNLIIAQLNQKAVTDSLQLFIEQYEPEFLEQVLGYELWQAFVAGLDEPSIDSKWLFLRDGGAFTGYDSRQHKWVGFAPAMSGFITGGLNGNLNPVVPIGSAAGTNTLTYAPLAGSTYWVERRGFGTMIEDVDISITNNEQTWTLLKSGDVFAANEIFIAHITRFAAGAPSAGNNYSPVAAYVYYHYMRDLQTQSMGVGETKATSQNAAAVSAAQKMVDAWNIMSKQLQPLWEYLNLNPTLYTEWNYGYNSGWSWWYNSCDSSPMRTINTIGI